MKKLMSKKYTKNTCALTAICYVSKKDEDLLIRQCIALNMKYETGLTDPQWQKIIRILKIKIKHILPEPVSLGQFIKDYPQGLFIVAQDDHLFVVDNGVIFDPRTKKLPGLRRTLVQAWKVLEVPSQI
jgi:hypothetical protein